MAEIQVETVPRARYDLEGNFLQLMRETGRSGWNGTAWNGRNDSPATPSGITVAGIFVAVRLPQALLLKDATWEPFRSGAEF